MERTRKDFLFGSLGLATVGVLAGCRTTATPPPAAKEGEDVLDLWQRETDQVTNETFEAYMRGEVSAKDFISLTRLDDGFEKILREVDTADVSAHPAVWMVYNMGVIVKTRESLFSIDLVHRRAEELAPRLDFALITHNHSDHYRNGFYRKMNGAGKTVISNFLDNYGAADWRKGGRYWEAGGFTRAEKTFRIRDVEIRTSLVDHNDYLIDFTTAFEIRVGDWILYHTGDCGVASKLHTTWGRPDLWVFFPGCGVNVADAERNVRPKQMSFGHLWELGHSIGRLTTPMVRAARKKALDAGTQNLTVPLWGERIV